HEERRASIESWSWKIGRPQSGHRKARLWIKNRIAARISSRLIVRGLKAVNGRLVARRRPVIRIPIAGWIEQGLDAPRVLSLDRGLFTNRVNSIGRPVINRPRAPASAVLRIVHSFRPPSMRGATH